MAKAPTTSRIDPRALALGEAKLQSSGLTLEAAERLRITFLNREQTAQLHPTFDPRYSLHLAYLDPFGEPLLDEPLSAPFYRLRYLDEETGFAAQTKEKPKRYVNELDVQPVAYYPSNADWPELLLDPSKDLIITEGELKAAKACAEEFHTIGLGGVYNWRAVKKGVTWLPSLDYPEWRKRRVCICFDSDYLTNPQVCHALHELAEALHERGARVHLVTLPSLPGLEKTGLDDFLVHAGSNANERFEEMLRCAIPLGLTQTLWELNNQYVYVRNPGLIIDQETMFKTGAGPFKEHLEANRTYHEQWLKPDGEISYKPVSAAAAWLSWPLRQEATKLTYQPGRERLFTENRLALFNIWPGWGVEAAEGDVNLFLQLVDHLFSTAEPEAKKWFLRWCAYPLQHPGVKLFTSVVFHGIKHGTGKSLVGYTLGRIYGQNFTEISQMDLHNGFNEWAEGRQLVMGDDVTGSNKRQDADFLKKLITQREIRINGKYVPSYIVPDCINYFFTANQPDAFFLEDDDRRFFIHEVQVSPLPEEFYLEYDLWLDTGGAAAVHHYLRALDLGSFNPAAPACRTTAKERMIVGVQSDLAGWVRQLLAAPDQVLRVGEVALDKDLFTAKELLQLYDPTGHTGTTANGLGRELSRAGIRQVCEGKPIRLADGLQGRYYAVRRPDTWLAAQPQAAVKHLSEWFQHQQPRPPKY